MPLEILVTNGRKHGKVDCNALYVSAGDPSSGLKIDLELMGEREQPLGSGELKSKG